MRVDVTNANGKVRLCQEKHLTLFGTFLAVTV